MSYSVRKLHEDEKPQDLADAYDVVFWTPNETDYYCTTSDYTKLPSGVLTTPTTISEETNIVMGGFPMIIRRRKMFV